MHGHDVSHLEQRGEIVATSGERGPRAMRGRELGNPTADPARAHDEHLLPLEALADHEVRPPLPWIAAAQRAVAFADAPQKRENERDRVLGGRVRQDSRRVADHHSSLARGVEIDVVESHRVVRDDAQLRPGGVEIRRVDLYCGSDDDSLCLARRRHELERLLELTLDLVRDAGPLVNARLGHGRYASITRGACEDE